jgi:hypothetical protein
MPRLSSAPARWRSTIARALAATAVVFLGGSSGCLDRAPNDFGRTPPGPGATVRYDLGHKPLPEVPLPNDTAAWPDPTSRTGLRINASLLAPTAIERGARERFSQMEGWGTFAPISVGFDVPRTDPSYQGYDEAAVDVANVQQRHRGDDYDFADDAVYLIDLETGVPQVLDVGAGNFDYTLRELDRYWANDYRQSERNLLFETIDESNAGSIESYDPEFDGDFDGVIDRPNFERPNSSPAPDAVCDDQASADYESETCRATRRERDRCVADNLLTFYERESDTLLLRPLLPLREMARYAVVLTDRLVDGRGNAVKSPFEHVFHVAQRSSAERVAQIFDDPSLGSYYGDLSGSGIARVAFVWSFTTQPTVDDLKRLRDGLYGQGPFARWKDQYPPHIEVQRMVGLRSGLADGVTEDPDWIESPLGQAAGCPDKAQNLWIARYEGLRDTLRFTLRELDIVDPGPAAEYLLRSFDNVSHLVVATFRAPFLLEGGPEGTDPNSAFRINYQSGEAVETEDTVQLWMVVPKETARHQQPFDVNIFGHGYTSAMFELILYAGLMAEHGVATVGINAMGHGLIVPQALDAVAGAALGGGCYGPFYDALTLGRTRDLNRDGEQDSGGDFWSSYLFHTRDGVRQSVLDHVQLVRIMRAWGTGEGLASCRNDAAAEPVAACDVDENGAADSGGDFDGNGVVDAGGVSATYGTWGESLGGILSGIHGALDPFVGSAVPGSGGGGLTDIGVRSFQGGVIEAVLLRIWGPLLVTVPAGEREACTPLSTDGDRCTSCREGQMSLRWVVPDVNGTGEIEIECLEAGVLANTTARVVNRTNGEVACARVDALQRFRAGLPASDGDEVTVELYAGAEAVTRYDSCELAEGANLTHTIERWGRGRFPSGAPNLVATALCEHPTCQSFQGRFFGEGTPLTAPAEGFGLPRQTPGLRRFLALAQAALEPGDPISFAPYYALRALTDPFGNPAPPKAVLTLNTIGDMNVPLNSGIAFARASGALPFLRPDQLGLYPHYADYVTPGALFAELGGRTPNAVLIESHVVEGITKLARHPAAPECALSANHDPAGATFRDSDGVEVACLPSGCTRETESDGETRVCLGERMCDFPSGTCVPRPLGQERCDEALFDADDLDEGRQLYFEQALARPLRLARLAVPAAGRSLDELWSPRLRGAPRSSDGGYQPGGRLAALLNAYVVPEGEHTFINGDPCQAFDHGTYLTRLVARFFETDGADLYYLSHPATHHCMETPEPSCDYHE